jgi:hypothetical protein
MEAELMAGFNLLTQSVLIIMGLVFLTTAMAIIGVGFLWSIHRDSQKQLKTLRGIHHFVVAISNQIRAESGSAVDEVNKAKVRERPRLGDRP